MEYDPDRNWREIDDAGFNAHIGVRQDDHQRFGGATSLGADISYAFGGGWRIQCRICRPTARNCIRQGKESRNTQHEGRLTYGF